MSSNLLWYMIKLWQTLDLPGFTRPGHLPKDKGKLYSAMTNYSVPPQFKIDFQPAADPAAVVQAGTARFTVLSSRLLRLEYSPGGQFEDRPSQVFWYRKQPVPPFEVDRDGDALEIRTQHLRLRCAPAGGPFGRKTLSIEVLATGRTWRFGDRDPENLRGTTRTLDGAGAPVKRLIIPLPSKRHINLRRELGSTCSVRLRRLFRLAFLRVFLNIGRQT